MVIIDFETYSEIDIKKVGAWVYSAHPSTEVICMSYIDTDKMDSPRLLTELGDIKSIISQYGEIYAWNSFFEYCVCVNVLSMQIPDDTFLDVTAIAAYNTLPKRLDKCALALGLDKEEQKDKRGKYLINKLSKPQRGKRCLDPELLEEMGEYCNQDIVVTKSIFDKLPVFSEEEKSIFLLDQRINARGIPINFELVENAFKMVCQYQKDMSAEVFALTEGEVADTNKREKVILFSEKVKEKLEKYTKEYLEKTVGGIKNTLLKRIIEIRLLTGQISVAKYEKLYLQKVDTGKIFGCFAYHSASTGRWGGRGVQPQNFPRVSMKKDIPLLRDIVKRRDYALLISLYDDPLLALSNMLRTLIEDPEYTLFVADYAAIEGRVLAWLAKEKEVLKVFSTSGLIYEHTASKIFKCEVEEVSKDQRFIGKVATLALGYQGGKVAFKKMADIYGKDIEEEEAEKIKKDWRKSNSNIVKLWGQCEKAFIFVINNKEKKVVVNDNLVFRYLDGDVLITLPSGRDLTYKDVFLTQDTRYKKESISFYGVDSALTRKWCIKSTYGGKIVENITQAVARDILSHSLLALDKKGYDIIMHIHDEIVTTSSYGSVKEMCDIMESNPPWAKDLPLAVEGDIMDYYGKL